MERKGKIAIFGIGIVVFILLIAAGVIGIYFSAGGGDYEKIVFLELRTVPSDAVIYPLTNEDYEKYPVLKEIPKSIRIDSSIFAPTFIRPGYVSEEIGDAIYAKYGKLRYIEHEGVVYEVGMYVA